MRSDLRQFLSSCMNNLIYSLQVWIFRFLKLNSRFLLPAGKLCCMKEKILIHFHLQVWISIPYPTIRSEYNFYNCTIVQHYSTWQMHRNLSQYCCGSWASYWRIVQWGLGRTADWWEVVVCSMRLQRITNHACIVLQQFLHPGSMTTEVLN